MQDLDGDGDLDIGTPMTNSNITDFFNARSSIPVAPPTALNAGQAEVLIGRATFTAGGGGAGGTFVNFVNRVESDGSPEQEGAVWFQDGGVDGGGNVLPAHPFNPAVAGAMYGHGTPVLIGVPEPTSLALVGVATLGLLARRRRDAHA